MAKAEKRTEAYLRTKVEQLGGLCIKMQMTFIRGMPDRLVLLYPGLVWFVETKKLNRKPDPLQAHIHEKLRRLGFDVRVVDEKNVKDFIEELKFIKQLYQ